MKLISPDFENNDKVPKTFTCDGDNISPHLEIDDVPENAESLVLTMQDPDAPGGTWTHWIVWNIDPDIRDIYEGAPPVGAKEGTTSSGSTAYLGPCPPGGEEHRYIFKLYAIDKRLELASDATIDDLIMELDGHILATAELTGKYRRQ